MALHPPPESESKLIFAPSSTQPTHGQAEQFTKHELLGLRRADLDPASPIRQFHSWFTAAQHHNRDSDGKPRAAKDDVVKHPETCTLSTASLPSGRVSARVVYMKELDDRGFVIYSNFGTSRKAADLFGLAGGGGNQPNPWAALTFWWEAMERQVRVEGRAERVTPEESQLYFDTRVRGSRIGAWASRQSQELRPEAGGAASDAPPPPQPGGDPASDDDGRVQLERWVRETEERFAGSDHIPVPDFWGGLRIVPLRVEFWQGRESRLHDRFSYERADEKGETWTLERLSP